MDAHALSKAKKHSWGETGMINTELTDFWGKPIKRPEMQEYSVVLFFSSNYSFKGSNVLKKNGIQHKMTPVPRHLSSDCGLCVRIERSDAGIVKDLFEKTEVEFDRIENI